MPDPSVVSGELHGLFTVVPEPVTDERGFFVRTMAASVLASAGVDPCSFIHENQSRSVHGVLRGLHTRSQLSEAKLIRCARGRVFEAVVDLRPWSPTFGSVETFTLDDTNHLQVYVPAGCAHGFQVLSADADVCYKHDAAFDPKLERAISWDDPDLAIAWPLADPLLSERDQSAPRLAAVMGELTAWYGSVPPGLGPP